MSAIPAIHDVGDMVEHPMTARVMVCGGGQTAGSGEIYDPALELWTPTNSAFYEHPSGELILLRNGRLLSCGGQFQMWMGFQSRSCELFYPVTGEWYATGRTHIERAFSEVVRLADGRVLIVGGRTLSLIAGLTSAEIYDPVTQVWAVTGSMAQERHGHTATLLPNGEVLVVGGASAEPEPTAELFSPTTGMWRRTSGPFYKRTWHTATLLKNGTVLIAGGVIFPHDGPAANYTETDAVEIYDVASGTWSAAGSLNTTRRYNHTTTLLDDGTALLVGGYNETSGRLADVELYDPNTRVWTPGASTSVVRSAHSATRLMDGRVLVAGGDSQRGDTPAIRLRSAEVYDPPTRSWSGTGSLHEARAGHAASLCMVTRVQPPMG